MVGSTKSMGIALRQKHGSNSNSIIQFQVLVRRSALF